jgi:hypothetical protein
MQCYECGGTGQSPRGYGDSFPCGSCKEKGYIPVSRFETLKYKIEDMIKKVTDYVL